MQSHQKLIVGSTIDELKVMVQNLEKRKFNIETLGSTYTINSYNKFKDFTDIELDERVDFYQNFLTREKSIIERFTNTQQNVQKRIQKINENLLEESSKVNYQKLKNFANGEYGKQYLENVNNYINGKNIEKPVFNSDNLETNSNLCEGGYSDAWSKNS